jgi:[acyl-carrier-protein] S-malonyltransferase
MNASATAMGERLRVVTYMQGKAPVYANVTAQAVTDPGEWPTLLEEQLRSPVRWTESVEAMITAGATRFVECGVGEVLGGLVRRVSKEVQTAAVFDSASLTAFAEVSRAF